MKHFELYLIELEFWVDKNCNSFLTIVLENRVGDFIQIVPCGDSLNEMSNPVFMKIHFYCHLVNTLHTEVSTSSQRLPQNHINFVETDL